MFSTSLYSSLATISVLFDVISGALLVRVPEFGSPDPSSELEMWIYVPDKVAPQPAVIMAVSALLQLR